MFPSRQKIDVKYEDIYLTIHQSPKDLLKQLSITERPLKMIEIRNVKLCSLQRCLVVSVISLLWTIYFLIRYIQFHFVRVHFKVECLHILQKLKKNIVNYSIVLWLMECK